MSGFFRWALIACLPFMFIACAARPHAPPPPPPHKAALPPMPDITVPPEPPPAPPVEQPPSQSPPPAPKVQRKRPEPPPVVLALVQRADAQITAGNLDGAVASLEQAARVAPKQPLPWYRLAQVKVKQGECAQAVQFAHKADTLSDDPAMREQTQQLVGKCKERGK